MIAKELPNGPKSHRALANECYFEGLDATTSEGHGPLRELKEALNEQGGQHEQSDISQRLPADALAFSSDGLRGEYGRPGSMVARLFDRASGETLIAIAGIPCATVMNAADVERIIEAVEDELECFVPPLSLRA